MLGRLLATSVAMSLTVVAMSALPVRSENPAQTDGATETDVLTSLNLEEQKSHEALGLAFNAPEGFSDVVSLGKQSSGIVFPDSPKLASRMIVRFAELRSNPDGWVQFSDTEQMTYAKYLFLGNNKPSTEQVQREFLGVPVTGEVQTVRTHNGYRYFEIYILNLEKSSRQVAIAFESDTRLPLVQAETTMNLVAQSLEELDPDEVKKLRKERKRAAKREKKLSRSQN